MRAFVQKPKAAQQTTSAKLFAEPSRAQSGQNRQVSSILHLQHKIGNHSVGRLLQEHPQKRDEARTRPLPRFTHDFRRAPTAIEDQGKTGAEAFEGEPMRILPEDPDMTPAPLNEEGLIDGEWTSEVVPRVFVNGGKTGTAIVNWAGGAGGAGNQGTAAISLVAPVIDTSGPPAAGGTAQAWVRAGTGTATVTRSYTGVLVGANGANYYITARAATRIDRHEANHITHSGTHHNTHITPLEARIAQHTGQARALSQGANEAAARTALETFLNWNTAITGFRNADTADNTPGGTVDTTDAASADFYRDYGARAVGGVNYAHYIDTPPGP